MRLCASLAALTALLLTTSPAAALAAPAAPADKPDKPEVRTDVTLPRMPLADYANDLIPDSVDDDHGIALGGIGSGLYPAGNDEYWLITDRGPNGKVEVDGDKRRTFPVPGFNPTLLRVTPDGSDLKILESVPIRTKSGDPVSGLSNVEGHDAPNYTWDAKDTLPYNPNGLDPEDLVRAPDGTFWAVDEYAPSLVHIGEDGTVLGRHVPEGLDLSGTDYPVVDSLPGILAHRDDNRGFEGLAMTPDGTLHLAVQSPLALPDSDAAEESRNTRLISFDVEAEQVTAERIYRMEKVKDFDDDEKDQSEMKISGLSAIDDEHLLVDERTDNLAKLYRIDLTSGTDVLGEVDDPEASPSLEELKKDDLEDRDIAPVEKSLVADLSDIDDLDGKIEGIAVLDDNRVAIINDNDFGLGELDEDGRLEDSGIPSRLLEIELDELRSGC